MKVILRSQSLLFTVLSIVLDAPIRRVKPRVEAVPRKPVVPAAAVAPVPESKRWNRVAL